MVKNTNLNEFYISSKEFEALNKCDSEIRYSYTLKLRVCQKFKTTLYINQTRNLSESHLSCEFSLFLIFKYSEMPPKAFYKAKTDANMV